MFNLKKISKKAWIEIAIAIVLLITELIWTLIYRFGCSVGDVGFDSNGFWSTQLYLELYMSRLLCIFLAVNLLYVAAVLVVNFKCDKNTKILELFGVALIAVMEIIVFYYYKNDDYYSHNWQGLLDLPAIVNLLVIFVQVNAFYAIVLQIAHSDKYKLCKIGVGVALPLIEFIVVWFLMYSSDSTYDMLCSCLGIAAIFANISVIYLVALRVIDSFCGKTARQKTEAVQNTAAENPIADVNIPAESDN